MLSLNYRDSRPIYEQVRDGLRRLIITGAIPAGDKLPSVRAMAAQLAINPNTIQRAYESLEQEGYAYSVPGKGSFAALPRTSPTSAGRSCWQSWTPLCRSWCTWEWLRRTSARGARRGRRMRND